MLAGFPVVDVRSRCTFGSYHDGLERKRVQDGRSMAFKEAMRRASPAAGADDGGVVVERPEDYWAT